MNIRAIKILFSFAFVWLAICLAFPAFALDVYVKNTKLSVEVMISPEDQAKGLSNRDSLAPDRGMLFIYDTPRVLTFWMKGMRFNIDIIWIRDNRVVGIEHDVPYQPPGTPTNQLPVYSSDVPADTVLETVAGFASRTGLKVGDFVRF